MSSRAQMADHPQLIVERIASHATFYPSEALDKPKTDSSETISFPKSHAVHLEPYLPPARGQSSPTKSTHHTQQDGHQGGDHSSRGGPASSTSSGAPTTLTRRPFVTLTYAQSLDSQLAVSPGTRTVLSGPASKAMTHFLRSRHAAILVGVGTAVADDPGLNCRLEPEITGDNGSGSGSGSGVVANQPRPVVLDPMARWEVTAESKVVQLARQGKEEEKGKGNGKGKGKGPWILHADGVVPDPERVRAVESVGGRYLPVPGKKKSPSVGPVEEMSSADGEGDQQCSLEWEIVLGKLWEEGVESLMVEGGGKVINDLLALANRGVDVVDSVIITIAPTWLGRGGVMVAPDRPLDEQRRSMPGPRLGQVNWTQMGEDMVMCGRVMR